MSPRQFEFSPTEAIASARRRDRYIDCPACASQSQRYLFHRTGVRFVRCPACELVYADPIDPAGRAYFDIPALRQHDADIDRRHLVSDFAGLVEALCDDFERRSGRRPEQVLLVGRWHPDFTNVAPAGTKLTLAETLGTDETRLVTHPLAETLGPSLSEADIVLLHEFLEAAHEPSKVLEGVSERLKRESVVAVVFANMQSMPSRLLRRGWKGFFDKKIAFYNSENLEALMWRAGFRRLNNERLMGTFSLGYVAARLGVAGAAERALTKSGLARLSGRVPSGRQVISFAPSPAEATERLSIIVPVYNEERYVRDVLDSLLAKELPIEREIVVVESNSDDGTRAIVSSFETDPMITTIYQDEPRGKGNAVRAALEIATGSIILIQDADFEYDLDDYDALLEPILQRRTSFVLGSRSLGLDDWKVRRFASSRVQSTLINLAQLAFARTFNLLYQQKVTDINTMLKVFRRECIEGCHLDGEGFNFDIELVCKIVRNGFAPLEIPVNYVARGFDEGKKITFLDAYPSYFELFRCRLGRI